MCANFFRKSTERTTKDGENGFTLIELMIVVAIIGILAMIATLATSAYRNRGFNATSQCDLKNMSIAQEAYFVDNQIYTTSVNNLISYGYTNSRGVVPNITGANNISYSMTASHASGDKTWTVIGPGGIIQ